MALLVAPLAGCFDRSLALSVQQPSAVDLVSDGHRGRAALTERDAVGGPLVGGKSLLSEQLDGRGPAGDRDRWTYHLDSIFAGPWWAITDGQDVEVRDGPRGVRLPLGNNTPRHHGAPWLVLTTDSANVCDLRVRTTRNTELVVVGIALGAAMMGGAAVDVGNNDHPRVAPGDVIVGSLGLAALAAGLVEALVPERESVLLHRPAGCGDEPP